MQDIPIFDSLAHPVLDIRPGSDRYTVAALIRDMRRYSIARTLVSRMTNSGEDGEAEFVRYIADFSPTLAPVAYADLDRAGTLRAARCYVSRLRSLGYVGIKVHPRRHGLLPTNSRILRLLTAAADRDLLPFVCTYTYPMVAGRYVDVIAETVGLLSALEGVPMVLMHSGSVRLLEMAEVVRGFPSALLDLSFTLCKYEGSSLDDDLYFLFRTMDQRLCVGSDYPEFSARDLRRRFNRLATGLCRHRAENIGFRNLSTVLGGAV